MVNVDRSNNSTEMGAFATRKHEQNGSMVPSLFSKQMDMGSPVYKLMIHIEKIRPKPCPKSKKSAFLTLARRLEQIRAGVPLEAAVQPPALPKRKAVCAICKEVFQSAQSLYLHKKKQHCRVCNICNVECTTKAALENHEKMHTLVQSETGKSGKPATRKSPLSESPPTKQVDQSAERLKDIEYSEKLEEKVKKIDARSAGNYCGVRYTCRVCSKDFATVEAAEIHSMDHMELVEEEHKCSICKKLFNNEMSLNEHLAEHLSRAQRCPVCPKAFINRATLRIHMKSHGQG